MKIEYNNNDILHFVVNKIYKPLRKGEGLDCSHGDLRVKSICSFRTGLRDRHTVEAPPRLQRNTGSSRFQLLYKLNSCVRVKFTPTSARFLTNTFGTIFRELDGADLFKLALQQIGTIQSN